MNMRNFFLGTGLALLLSGCVTFEMPPAGEILEEKVESFQRVVEAPGSSSDDIYKGTKIWIAENFKSSKAVIELDSKEDGILIGNGRTAYQCEGWDCFGSGGQTVSFTMRVDIQNERFRLTFSNFSIRHPSTTGFGPSETPIHYKTQKERIESTLLSYGDLILDTIRNEQKATKGGW